MRPPAPAEPLSMRPLLSTMTLTFTRTSGRMSPASAPSAFRICTACHSPLIPAETCFTRGVFLPQILIDALEQRDFFLEGDFFERIDVGVKLPVGAERRYDGGADICLAVAHAAHGFCGAFQCLVA